MEFIQKQIQNHPPFFLVYVAKLNSSAVPRLIQKSLFSAPAFRSTAITNEPERCG